MSAVTSVSEPVVIETPVPVPDNAALHAELGKLAKPYPEPDWREVGGDREWFYAEASKGTLDDYLGKVVAVHERQVVAVGSHDLVMLIQLTRQYRTHPGRFYMVYHGDPFEPA